MIGILGGTFDPPHNAHLKIAEYLLNEIPLEKILFIPCYLPLLKQSPTTSAAHRLAMVSAAISGKPKFEIDDREIKRAQPSYTIDSLHSIRSEIPKAASLSFIMGSDAFNHFLEWKNWQEILRLSHLLIVERSGHALNQNPTLLQVLAAHQSDSTEKLLSTPAGKIVFCKMPAMDIASTEIRQQLHENPKKAKDQLPLAVWDYIRKYKLYSINTESERIFPST